MFISHRHHFVFVQLPRAGGTAVAAEIAEHYGAERILSKHSSYNELLRIARRRVHFPRGVPKNSLGRSCTNEALVRWFDGHD